MTPHSRKLLPLNYVYINNVNSSNTITFLKKTSSSSSSFGEQSVRDTHEEGGNSYSPTCCFKLNPPFDSAMALTVLVLLTAFFFMGFFSIYIRRFADENSVDPTRRRRTAASHLPPLKKGGKGVDPTVVGSLPAYKYAGGDVEEGEGGECPICLGEFEKREWVKNIPYCGHVFHVQCIDTWLSNHVTCPLCRTAEFFSAVLDKEVREENESVSGHVVEGGRDTWRVEEREGGPTSVRRTSSCSWYGERVTLHRSLSF